MYFTFESLYVFCSARILRKELQQMKCFRLSEIQSRLLKMNNPEITDLSDENRPTVLGEKLKRVYEDEWTDAFEFLTEKREEKLADENAINILYSLLKVYYIYQLYITAVFVVC